MQTGIDMVKLYTKEEAQRSFFWEFFLPFLIGLGFILVSWVWIVLLGTSKFNM